MLMVRASLVPFVAAASAAIFGATGLVLNAMLNEDQNQDQDQCTAVSV